MAEEKSRDIIQDFVDLYEREQMLGFFEFCLDCGEHGEVRGLCRISQPKAGSSGMRYLSLTFLADTQNAAARARVEEALERLSGDDFKRELPEATDVVPGAVLEAGREASVGQIDVLLDKAFEVDRRFLAVRVLPAVRRCAGLSADELVWWAEADEPKPASPATLADRVRGLLGKK